MQRLLLIILVSFFFITSCHKSTPKGILPEQQMVELMTEVHTIDGYLNTLPIDSSRRVIDGLYGQVFAKYNLDSISFQQNVSYYLGNAVKAKGIYAEITKKLRDYENVYRKEDSLRNVVLSDSIRRVNYFEKQKEEAHKLIFEYPKDTVAYNHLDAFASVMGRLGIRVDNPKPSVAIPSVSQQAPSVTEKNNSGPMAVDSVSPRPIRQLRPERIVQ